MTLAMGVRMAADIRNEKNLQAKDAHCMKKIRGIDEVLDNTSS
jgi:hypothetical protein